MLGKDVYRFAGVYQFSEVTDKGRLFRRPLDARRRRRIPPQKLSLLILKRPPKIRKTSFTTSRIFPGSAQLPCPSEGLRSLA